MGAAVAGTTSATKFRPLRSYTTLWDVTRKSDFVPSCALFLTSLCPLP